MAILRRKTPVMVWAIAALLGALSGCQRAPLLAWYAVRQLAAAEAGERDGCVRRVVELDDAVVPGLLSCLERDDEKVCANVEAALDALVDRWGGDDARTLHLA